MGLQKIVGKLVSAAIQAPRVMGVINIVTRPHSTGNRKSLLDLAIEMNGREFLYNAREMLGGIDSEGKIQPVWLKQTWTPVIAGDLVTRGLQLIRSTISEALS